jgi:NADH-quinone oxidoreductase subunit J
MTQAVLFYLFSLIAVVSGLVVVTRENPISSALALVVCFFCLAADYVLLQAQFVAVIQILVYAGAIMVLFIFVIMLLNLRGEGVAHFGDLRARAFAGVAAAGLLGVGLVAALDHVVSDPATERSGDFGTIASVGNALFAAQSPFLLPFEAISLLLTVGMVGAVVLAKRDL